MAMFFPHDVSNLSPNALGRSVAFHLRSVMILMFFKARMRLRLCVWRLGNTTRQAGELHFLGVRGEGLADDTILTQNLTMLHLRMDL